MTYRDIEASRNVRLWLTQVALPVASLTVTALIALPDTRRALGQKVVQIKDSIKNTFKRKSGDDDKRVIISMDARNREEALAALEVMARDVYENYKGYGPIKKSVQVRYT